MNGLEFLKLREEQWPVQTATLQREELAPQTPPFYWSCPSAGISSCPLDNEIYPGAKKIFLHPWILGSAVERQWVTDGWRRAGTA